MSKNSGIKIKNRNQLVSSESDEEARQQSPPRSSSRLKRKSQRSSFVLPSRNKIWDAIPSTSGVSFPMKSYSPKKTVNDFTKIRSTYNYDDYEDSSHDDSDGFITDSSGCSDSESEDEDKPKRKSGRVKNFRRRIMLCSSSDEENNSNSNVRNKKLKKSECEDDTPEGRLGETDSAVDKSTTFFEDKVDCIADDNNDRDSTSSEEIISPAKLPRNTSVLDSSDESECKSPESESDSSDGSGSLDEHGTFSQSRSSKFEKRKEDLFKEFKSVQNQRKGLAHKT